nr:4-alpha-glucanotransferase [Oscillospiraceae bacterium]
MRKSGILMHISSLPGPYGIGTMGKRAYEFVDFLEKAGQAYWQILPLSPTGYGNSPYQSFSTYAGSPYLIDLDTLVEEGLLKQAETDAVHWGGDPEHVDFGILYNERFKLLKLAFERFVPGADFAAFVADNAQWLPDYALFAALKEQFGGQSWQNWSDSLMMRAPEVLEDFRKKLAEQIRFVYFQQFLFFRQWDALHAYANSKGIQIIGDVPIYVPLDSADVWAEPELFLLDEGYRPKVVAGCPPDSFNADGQLWGNPIYDWEKMKKNGYNWWIRRMAAAARMYDVVRFDHFRGFESYWAVPAQCTTAAGGSWQPGPGMDFINAIQKALPQLDCIAEDLGYMTPEVRQLQLDSGYPSMKVLQFGFDSREDADYQPHTYPVNSVCYSGTHDNPPLALWLEDALPEDIEMATNYLGLNEKEGFIPGLIRGCMASVSKLCVIQMQDYLELGRGARMNSPGFLGDNWLWRAKDGVFTDSLAQRIYTLTKRFSRL